MIMSSTVHFTCILTLISRFYCYNDPRLDPNPFLSSYFQMDKLIFGCVDAIFRPPVTLTYQ